MLRSWWRLVFGVVLFLLIASCSGGGCASGCSGCGVKPLAGGFPSASVIPNAASVRLTRPGLDFLQNNLPALTGNFVKSSGGVIKFPIPKSDGSTTGVSYTICSTGPDENGSPPKCIAEIDLAHAKLAIDSVVQFDPKGGAPIVTEPGITITGTIPVRVQDLPVHFSVIGIGLNPEIGVGVGDCNNGYPEHNGQRGFDYKEFPVSIFIPLVKDTTQARDGYTKIDGKNAVVNPQITANDVAICEDCTVVPLIGQPICNAVFGAIKNAVFGTLVGGVTGQLKNAITSATCTQANFAEDPPCPHGSHPDTPSSAAAGDAGDAGPPPSAKCVLDSDPGTCMPIELGLDGHIDLGGLLASLSPGTSGGLDFVLAASGDMIPAPSQPVDASGHTSNGLTLGMLGGALAQPQSSCVPAAPNPIPLGIPIPDELTKDKPSPWPASDPTGPHVGIALAGRFLDHALGGVYNSGLLCLGVSTENFQQLNSGLLSVLIPGIKKLTFEEKGAAAAVTTRPQAPPTIKIGNGTDLKKDPLLAITLPKFSVDFYIWSEDRFVRAFTFQADIGVPVNLQTGKDPKKNPNGGLLPVLGDLTITNGTVTNAELLTDDPSAVSTALSSILGGIVGQVLGSLKPIDISGALKSAGVTLTIPDGGIRKLSKDKDDFLAIFADLAVAPPPSPSGPGKMPVAPRWPALVDTRATLASKTVHAEAMGLSTARKDLLPSLRVLFSSPDDDGTVPLEYTWRVDDGTWSAWSKERDVTIQNDALFLQGKHELQVAARVAGHTETEDESPAVVPFTIDALPPFVRVARDRDGATIEAWDVVSGDALTARVRTTDAAGRLSSWSDWRPLAEVARVDARATAVDVEVRDEEGNVGSVSEALIRGRPDPTLGSSAGCGGCTMHGRSGSDTAPLAAIAIGVGLALLAARRRGRARRAASSVLGLGAICAVAATSQGCACGDNGGNGATTGCGADCNTACGPALPVGLVGAYTSVAKAKDGTIWVSGYNDAVFSQSTGDNQLYGDLVVGQYDAGKKLVQWTTVDGVPPLAAGACPDDDPKGWRGGISDSGPDVGLWTSLQLDANDRPMVSYYDATNHALKFASYDGATWSTHTVVGGGGSDAGLYDKMLVVDGKPVIAFLVVEKGNGGHTRSKVTLAHANVAVPHAPADWALEDAVVDESGPCRPSTCDAGQACLTTGDCAATVGGCSPADCGGAGNACVTQSGKPTCVKTVQTTDIHPYPNAVGDYVSMAVGPQGIGLVVYDRLHGNLVGASNVGGRWAATVLDGETGSRSSGTAQDTGDVGLGASLAIDASGDWHISYVNGIQERLQYLKAPKGQRAADVAPAVVDDGTGVDGQPFTDGIHVVGDDSFLQVGDGGSVTITYQDATAGTLRIATRQADGKWQLRTIAQPGRFAGFFPHIVPGDTAIANWWRAVDPATKDTNGDVAIVSP